MSQWLPEKALKQLEGWQLTAFSIAVTERMYPNFSLFSSLLEFGDRDQIRSILDGVWNRLSNSGPKMNFEVQQLNVEANMPDLNEFDMYGASPALDAMVALYSVINCLLEPDRSEAVNIANLSLESVATFIEVTSDPEMSDEELLKHISNHDLMLQEEDFQESLVQKIAGMKNPTASLLAEIKTFSSNGGVSNIGVSDA